MCGAGERGGLGATFRKTSKWICADQRNRRRHNENDHTLSGDFHRQDQRHNRATYSGDRALLDYTKEKITFSDGGQQLERYGLSQDGEWKW